MTNRQSLLPRGLWQRICIKVSVGAPPITRREATGKEKEKTTKNEKGDHL